MDLYGDTMHIDSKLLEPQIQQAVQYLRLNRHLHEENFTNPADFTFVDDQPECSFMKIFETLLGYVFIITINCLFNTLINLRYS